jgi:hypothetical protein
VVASPSSPFHVTEALAERLMNAFGAVDAVDHAIGGRASVDVSGLSVITSSNGALEDDAPLFLVPMTRASFEDAAESPSHREVKDAPQLAALLYDAVGAVDASLTGSGEGVTSAKTADVSCEGHGPGAGDDPNHPPPRTATCQVKSEAGSTFTVDGQKALRLVQGFIAFDAVDHAMGGRFSVEVAAVSCERRKSAELSLEMTKCRVTANGKTLPISDEVPSARVLGAALQAAGLEADSAMGSTGVTASRVSCSKGPGRPTDCTIER